MKKLCAIKTGTSLQSNWF